MTQGEACSAGEPTNVGAIEEQHLAPAAAAVASPICPHSAASGERDPSQSQPLPDGRHAENVQRDVYDVAIEAECDCNDVTLVRGRDATERSMLKDLGDAQRDWLAFHCAPPYPSSNVESVHATRMLDAEMLVQVAEMLVPIRRRMGRQSTASLMHLLGVFITRLLFSSRQQDPRTDPS